MTSDISFNVDPNSCGIYTVHFDNFECCSCVLFRVNILHFCSFRAYWVHIPIQYIVGIPIGAPLSVHVDQLLVGLCIGISSDAVQKNGDQG